MCGSSLRQVCPLVAGASKMAFGLMNTRRYALLYSFLASLFMNCVSVNWTMWSVLTISLFMLTLTDFMFFQVHSGLLCPIGSGAGGEGRVALLSQAASLRPGSCRFPPARRSPLHDCTLPCYLARWPAGLPPSLRVLAFPTPRCARRAGQRVLVTRRETLLACSLILPMRAASGGGFSSVLAARGRERRERTRSTLT